MIIPIIVPSTVSIWILQIKLKIQSKKWWSLWVRILLLLNRPCFFYLWLIFILCWLFWLSFSCFMLSLLVWLRLLGLISLMLMIPWLDLFQIHVGLFNLDLGYTSIVYFLFLYWSFLELNTVFLVSSSHETSSFTIKYIDLQINRDFINDYEML